MAAVLTAEQMQFLVDNGLRRVLRKDDSAAHQIRMRLHSETQLLAVSCCCRCRPIETRPCWQPGEAVAAWRKHVTEAGEAIT